MKEQSTMLIASDETIINQIYYIRGQKVMLDRDLAKLYDVPTKVLKQSVKRNITRFPEDFMFEMTIDEFKNWRSQFVTSNADQMGLRYAPFCFSEQGVAMLSSILNSERAVNVNIQIIRIFIRIRQMFIDNTEIRLEIEKIKGELNNHEKNMEVVFQCLDKLSLKIDGLKEIPQPQPRKRIGFKSDEL